MVLDALLRHVEDGRDVERPHRGVRTRAELRDAQELDAILPDARVEPGDGIEDVHAAVRVDRDRRQKLHGTRRIAEVFYVPQAEHAFARLLK